MALRTEAASKQGRGGLARLEEQTREPGKVDWENASNQPKALPVLRMFQDLRFSFRDLVASGLCGRAVAATRKVSRMHAASLPAHVRADG
jgi:hypothetical protein